MQNHVYAGAIAVLLIAVALPGAFAQAAGVLRVCPDNPRYLTDGSGKPMYLAGSHTWLIINDDLDPKTGGIAHAGSKERAEEFADWLQQWGMNYTRYWSGYSYLPRGIMAWNRNGAGNATDGKPRVDFTSFNEEYFDRLKFQVAALEKRGIYTSLMLFGSYNGFRDAESYRDVAWHPDNNVNNLGMSPTDGTSFFDLKNAALLKVQEAHVRKMIDEFNGYDSILWEIINEPKYPESFAWQQHMVDYVHNYEKTKPKQHLVIMSSGNREAKDTLKTCNAEVISPDESGSGNWAEGGKADFIAKVVFNDTDHIWGSESDPLHMNLARQFVWKTFTRGHNALYMDAYDNNTSNSAGRIESSIDPVRHALRATIAFSKRLDLAKALPDTTTSSTRYALVDPGKTYLVYQPLGCGFTVDVRAGRYRLEWFNPQTDSPSAIETVTCEGGKMSFKAPFDGDAVLFLRSVR